MLFLTRNPQEGSTSSQKIDLADEPGEVHLELLPGLTAAQGGAPITYTTSNSISIPSKRDVFHIESASISIVKSPDLKLERVLSIATTEPVSSESLAGSLELYMLPDCLEKKNKSVCKNEDSFGDAARVFDEVLSKAEVIPFTVLPHDQALSPNFLILVLRHQENESYFYASSTASHQKRNFHSIKTTAPYSIPKSSHARFRSCIVARF